MYSLFFWLFPLLVAAQHQIPIAHVDLGQYRDSPASPPTLPSVGPYFANNIAGKPQCATHIEDPPAGEEQNLTNTISIYATVSDHRARVLIIIDPDALHEEGNRLAWDVNVGNLTSVGLPETGTLDVSTLRFGGSGVGTTQGRVEVVVDQDGLRYSGDEVVVRVSFGSDGSFARGFEFEVLVEP